MMTILKSPIEEYTHVIHVADIHIRLNKRHDEYRIIFMYRPYYDEKNSALIQSINTAFVQVSACAKIDKHISVFVCSRCFENVKNP